MKKSNNKLEHNWSEDRLQQTCFMHFNNTYSNLRGLLFSVPNGILMVDSKGRKNWAMIKRFKSTGLWEGVSDLIFLYGGRAYLLELKRPDGKNGQSKGQITWQEQVENQGFTYILINSFDVFKDIIEKIINFDVLITSKDGKKENRDN